ncbi:polysaccharide biosynthesis protein EpsC, partial [Lederbergia galactosidilytica]
MTYPKRLSLLILLDSAIVLFSIYIGYFLLHPFSNFYTSKLLLMSSLILLGSHHLFAFLYRLYNKVWEYASVGELLSIAKAVTFSILTAAIAQYIAVGHVYWRVLFITWMLHILLIGGSRFSWRMVRDSLIKSKEEKRKTLIVGAG